MSFVGNEESGGEGSRIRIWIFYYGNLGIREVADQIGNGGKGVFHPSGGNQNAVIGIFYGAGRCEKVSSHQSDGAEGGKCEQDQKERGFRDSIGKRFFSAFSF